MVELCEQKLPTYFIDDASKIISQFEIISNDWKTKNTVKVNDFIPQKPVVKILMTSGASCPDAVVESVIQKIAGYFGKQNELEAITQQWLNN